jgi:hypothetical protein
MVSPKDFAIERKDGKGTGTGHGDASANYPPNVLYRAFITQTNGKSSKPNSHNAPCTHFQLFAYEIPYSSRKYRQNKARQRRGKCWPSPSPSNSGQKTPERKGRGGVAAAVGDVRDKEQREDREKIRNLVHPKSVPTRSTTLTCRTNTNDQGGATTTS